MAVNLGGRLFEACRRNNIEEAAGLIAQGADVNYANDWMRYTPLHDACEHDSPALATLLLDSGANIEAKDVNGKTPIFNANEVTLPVLLQRGANIHARDNYQHTPLHSAIADDNNLDVFCALLEGGAKVEARCGEESSPRLCLRAEKGILVLFCLCSSMEPA